MSGWISLHRKVMDNPIYSNANMLKLWVHCLLKATHSEREQLVGNQMVKLEPGQFVTGRESLAAEFNKGAKKAETISAITLFRWLNSFEEWGMLNIKKTTKYSVVTVLNWSEYQGNEQQVNIKRTSNEHQMNTNNNVNNVNKENNDNNKDIKRPKQVYDDASDEMVLVNFFEEEIRKNDPKFKVPNKQTWANEIRLLIKARNGDKKEIAQVIRFVQADEFEKANVLSAAKLRKRFPALLMKTKGMNTYATATKNHGRSDNEEYDGLSI